MNSPSRHVGETNNKLNIHIELSESSVNFSQSEPKFDIVIVRFAGEVGIKAAWTRKLYERRLISNIRAVLKHSGIHCESINRAFGRIYLKTDEAQTVSQKLSRVFGVSSVSAAVETTSKLEDIIDTSVPVAGARFRRANSFAVRCRRVGEHAYTSQDVCRQVGRRILDAYPQMGLRVNLTHPDITLGVEVRDSDAFIFADSVKGAGGLPLGTQPKLVCLLTNDVNSAVASWLTMRRGCPSVLIYFDDSSFDKTNRLDSVLSQAQAISEYALGFPRELRIISNGQNLKKIVAKCPNDLVSLVCSRMMFRIAELIAESQRAEGIVTGETFSDKPVETLRRFRLEDSVVRNYPIYRPLQGLDNAQIAELAQKIGIRPMTPSEKRVKDTLGTINPKELESLEEKMLKLEGMIEASLNSVVFEKF